MMPPDGASSAPRRTGPLKSPVRRLLTFLFSRDTGRRLQHLREQEQSQNALIESERRFRDLFYNAPVGYHEIDGEGRITCINTTELSMLGYASEEMIGHHVWEFIGEADVARGTFAQKLAGTTPLAPSSAVSSQGRDAHACSFRSAAD
jgi:PAS domain-containing protein